MYIKHSLFHLEMSTLMSETKLIVSSIPSNMLDVYRQEEQKY